MLLFNSNVVAKEGNLKHFVNLEKIDYLQYNSTDKQVGDVLFSKDFVLGRLDAPITIIEYYSFSCVHCADFVLNVIPFLKKNYIDTGKVKLILRDFPLDRASLNASMLLKCYVSGDYCTNGNNCSGRDLLVLSKAILTSRKNWDSKNALYMINAEAVKSGMTEAEVQSCLKDDALQNKIVHSKLIAIHHLGVSAIPAFFINSQLYSGTTDGIIPFIDNILQEAK